MRRDAGKSTTDDRGQRSRNGGRIFSRSIDYEARRRRDPGYAPASGMSHQQHYFSHISSYLHSIINAISLLNLLSAVKYLKLKVSSPTRSFRLHSILSSVVTNRRYEAWILQGSIFRLLLPNWPFYIRFSIVFPEAFL